MCDLAFVYGVANLATLRVGADLVTFLLVVLTASLAVVALATIIVVVVICGLLLVGSDFELLILESFSEEM